MECPREITAIQFLAGELSHDEVQEWRSHALHCPACAQALKETEFCWNALSAWDADLSNVDLTQRVMAEAGVFSFVSGNEERSPSMGKPSLLRIAASLLVAAGLGVAVGRWAPLNQSSSLHSNSVPQEEQIPSWDTGVETFTIESATGLGAGLTPTVVPSPGEQP